MLDCTGTAPIEFVQPQAQNCSYQALGTTQHLQAEVYQTPCFRILGPYQCKKS